MLKGLSPAELNTALYDTDFHESSQIQPNTRNQVRSPISTEIHSVLVMPIPDLGGPLITLLMPRTQAQDPSNPGFWKGAPGSFLRILPDTTWLHPPVCWQVPSLLQSKLVHIARCQVEDRTTSLQISTAIQRWRKAHQNQEPALVQVQLTRKEPFETATSTKAQ